MPSGVPNRVRPYHNFLLPSEHPLTIRCPHLLYHQVPSYHQVYPLECAHTISVPATLHQVPHQSAPLPSSVPIRVLHRYQVSKHPFASGVPISTPLPSECPLTECPTQMSSYHQSAPLPTGVPIRVNPCHQMSPQECLLTIKCPIRVPHMSVPFPSECSLTSECPFTTRSPHQSAASP